MLRRIFCGLPILAGLVLLGGMAVHASDAPTVPADLKLHATAAGWYVTSAQGLPLYTYEADRDHPEVSACSEVCQRSWHVLAAAPTAQAVGPWAPLTRSDGQSVWTYDGIPLYTYVHDAAGSGLGLGDGVDRQWDVVFIAIDPPLGMRILGTTEGHILVDDKERPLYTLREGKASDCVKDCLRQWQPVAAPWMARSTGDWAVVTRADDNARQWAYRGQPLYAARSGDQPPVADETWQLVVLDPPPQNPAWVTSAMSDFGEVLADQQGHSLYRLFLGDVERVKNTTCNDACITANWKPMHAAKDERPVGYWSIREGYDGRPQWAYKGGLVFTFAHDARPGDTDGEKFAGMNSPWTPILAEWNKLTTR